MRRLRNIKQSHLAELLGVTQGTVSRWEADVHAPEPEYERRLMDLFASPLDTPAQAALRRLVETSVVPVHLVCDFSHRLLAASPAREAAWRRSAAELRGQSLFSYATDQIREAERRLNEIGWYESDSIAVVGWSDDNHSDELRIVPQFFLWERITLSDGTVVRMDMTRSRAEVESLASHVRWVVPRPPRDMAA